MIMIAGSFLSYREIKSDKQYSDCETFIKLVLGRKRAFDEELKSRKSDD